MKADGLCVLARRPAKKKRNKQRADRQSGKEKVRVQAGQRRKGKGEVPAPREGRNLLARTGKGGRCFLDLQEEESGSYSVSIALGRRGKPARRNPRRKKVAMPPASPGA